MRIVLRAYGYQNRVWKGEWNFSLNERIPSLPLLPTDIFTLTNSERNTEEVMVEDFKVDKIYTHD